MTGVVHARVAEVAALAMRRGGVHSTGIGEGSASVLLLLSVRCFLGVELSARVGDATAAVFDFRLRAGDDDAAAADSGALALPLLLLLELSLFSSSVAALMSCRWYSSCCRECE